MCVFQFVIIKSLNLGNAIYGFFKKSSSTANVYHIAKLAERLVQYDQDTSIYMILSLNLLFNFMDVIYNPYIFDFLHSLMSPLENKYNLTWYISI